MQYPASTTNMMPSTVRDVSAIFVATMHFLTPSGAWYKKKEREKSHTPAFQQPTCDVALHKKGSRKELYNYKSYKYCVAI